MMGLLKKDFLIICKSIWIILIVPLIVISLMYYFNMQEGIISFFAIFMTMQGISTILADRISGWNLMATTFAISRKKAVSEKYIISIILFILGFLIGLIFLLYFSGDLSSEVRWINILIAAIFCFSIIAVAIPAATLLPESQFFIAIGSSFIIPACCIAKWSSSITAQQIIKNGIPAGVEMNYQMLMLSGMAVCCFILCILSLILAPTILSKMDQR